MSNLDLLYEVVFIAMKLLLTLSYMGSNFCGYQVQPNGKRTVQGELTRASEELFGKRCDITGCSRTDSGVHANMFCATVTERGTDSLNSDIPISKICDAFNAHLPDDISVYRAEWRDESFHPRYGVKKKEYLYRIYNRRERSPFENGRSWHIPAYFGESELECMKECASAYIGTHDFTGFSASGCEVEDRVRIVYSASVIRTGDIIEFRVSADGFLYNMVRIMAGTLVMSAKKKLDRESINRMIETKDRKEAGETAPACGLYLDSVEY